MSQASLSSQGRILTHLYDLSGIVKTIPPEGNPNRPFLGSWIKGRAEARETVTLYLGKVQMPLCGVSWVEH
jgi:hypothetical protein